MDLILILLLAAVICVPLTQVRGLGAIPGYLLAGLLVGPSCLKLVTDVNTIVNVSQWGVVMMLFVIGLELAPRRLWAMRMEVFALGGNSDGDDASETGYYLARGFTTELMRHLSAELAGTTLSGSHGLLLGLGPKEAGKWLARIVEKVAARFGVVVSEKFAAQAVPVIGAVAGATLNTMFTGYYQDMARGHFIVRRLERKHGFETVRLAYGAISGRMTA